MTHPGPPRFVTVGDRVELAPRDPDPAASYEWRLDSRPAASTARVGDGPVESLEADALGTYEAVLTGPDGEHRLTVRAFPEDVSGAGAPDTVPCSRASGADGELVGRGVRGTTPDDRNEYPSGARPTGGDAAGGEGDRDGGGRPRIRLDGGVDDGAAVIEATVRPNPASDATPADVDVVFLVDDRDRQALPSGAVTVEGATLRVPLGAVPDRLRVHAVAVGDGGISVPDVVDLQRVAESTADPADDRERDLDRTGGPDGTAGLSVSRPYDPPEWAVDARVYEVYVRTFAGDSETGHFEAIADRLDYLEELGVDVLWLTPVLENDHAPHGYNIRDFFSIASDLGTREEYERLIERAHDRGIAVLFDLVFNHSARTHPFFRAAVDDPDSEYRDWYEWQAPGVPGTYFDWEHIANFSFDELAVRRHLLDVVDEWADLVDGFRCDMAWAVPDAFWREVHDRVKARDPEFLLLDETIPYVPEFQAGMFDVHFDSTTAFTLREVGKGNQPAETILDAIDERARIGFPDYAGFMLYAENHDEGRYVTVCGREPAFAAAGALVTLPGAPMVYAGQEFGQMGRRDDLVWDTADELLQDHYRSLLALRDRVPALETRAPVHPVDYDVKDGDADRVVAYARGSDGVETGGAGIQSVPGSESGPGPASESGSGLDAGAVGVVLNFGPEPATASLGPDVGRALYLDGGRESSPTAVGDGGEVVVDSVAVVEIDEPN